MLEHLGYVMPVRKAGLGELKPVYYTVFSRLANAGRNTDKLGTRRVIKKLGQRIAKEGLLKNKKPVDTGKFVAWLIMNHSSYDYCLTAAMETFMGSAWLGLWSDHEGKVENREWTHPVWVDTAWFQGSPYRLMHYLHGSTKIEGNVAYAESVEKAQADRYITTKPGRYLAKFFGDVLSEREIKEWADKQVAAMKPAVVKWANTEVEMIRAINLGPSDSCMSAGFYGKNERWFAGHIHPAAIYATPDITVAYLEDHDGKIVSRAVCNVANKYVARCYGDSRLLVPALEALGWTQQSGALEGCRIRKIENSEVSSDSYIMAYVDAGTGSGGGSLGYEDAGDDEYWILCESHNRGNTYAGYENKGVTRDEPQCTCEMCDEGMDEDDTYYIDSTSQSVCASCRDYHFTIAMGRRHEDWFPNDDVIEVDGDYYATEWATNHGICCCELSGDWYHEDDMVTTSRGMVHQDQAVALDVEDDDGNNHVCTSDVATTHDGRTIHRGNVVEHTVGDEVFICHDEDDLEALTAEKEEA